MNIKSHLVEERKPGFYHSKVISNPDNDIYKVTVSRHNTLGIEYTEVEFMNHKEFILLGNFDLNCSDVFSLLTGVELLNLILKIKDVSFEKGVRAKQREILEVLGLR